jgi:MFS family permease
VLAASLAFSALGAVGFIVGSSFAVFFLARALMGLGSGGLWMCVTMGTLASWPGHEYRSMGRLFAAYMVGGLLGPALGAIGGIRAPFLAYLGLLVVGGLSGRMLRGTMGAGVFQPDRSALRLRGFWLACAGIMFSVVAMGVMDGVLPLHFAEQLDQHEIGGLYIATALVAAASATLASSFRPRALLLVAVVLIVGGITIAGASSQVPFWLMALILTGVGNGIANTGSMGVLLESVATERIITALVVWSQFSVVGYLLGPTLGGAVSQAFGYRLLGIVPLAAAIPLLVLLFRPTE